MGRGLKLLDIFYDQIGKTRAAMGRALKWLPIVLLLYFEYCTPARARARLDRARAIRPRRGTGG
jgi:hypothetical protein